MIEAWAPTVICLLALGTVWGGIRGHKKDTDKKINCVKAENKEYLKKESHTLLCENAALKINSHITDEFKVFKKEILDAINGGK